MKINSKHKTRNYIIVLLFLFMNTSPFFSTLPAETKWFPFFILILIIVNKRDLLTQKIVYFLLAIYTLIIIQGILFTGFTPAAIYKPILLFFTPYVLYKIMGTDYFKYLFNIIFFFAVFTLPIWIFQCMSSGFANFLYSLAEKVFVFNWDVWPRSLLIYTIRIHHFNEQIGLYRNAGIFHEPGAYATFLILAIIINSIYSKNYFNRKIIILMIILLTTLSTMGFIVLFIYLLYAINQNPRFKKNTIWRLTSIGLLIILIIYGAKVFRNTYFLSSKIKNRFQGQIYNVQQKSYEDRGRFFSFFTSLRLAFKYPLTGRGIITKNTYEKITATASVGYGFAGLFMRYGFIVGLIYLYLSSRGVVYLSVRNGKTRKVGIIFFLIINLPLLTQAFFMHVSFVMFFVIGLVKYKKQTSIKQKHTKIDYSTIHYNR